MYIRASAPEPHETMHFNATLSDSISLPTHRQYSACLRSVTVDLMLQNVRAPDAYIEISTNSGASYLKVKLTADGAYVNTVGMLCNMITAAIPKDVRQQVRITATKQNQVKIKITDQNVKLRLSAHLSKMLGFGSIEDFGKGNVTSVFPPDLWYKFRTIYVCMPNVCSVNNMQVAVLRPIALPDLRDSTVVSMNFIDDFFVPVYSNFISHCTVVLLDANFDQCYSADLSSIDMVAVIDVRPRYVLSL